MDSPAPHLERLACAALDETRAQAASALSRFPDRAHQITPALVKALGDREPVVLVEAARTLGTFGPTSLGAIPSLERLLDHDNELVRTAARQALERIQGS